MKQPTTVTTDSIPDLVDVAIVGGGPVGLTLALALAQAFRGEATIALVAPGDASPTADGRATAIAAASVAMLEALGVWSAIAPLSEPVRRIEITDSSLDAGARPVSLAYDPGGPDGRSTMTIVPNASLLAALEAGLVAERASGLVRIAGMVTELGPEGGATRNLALDRGDAISARLVVAADGRRSRLREQARIGVVGWPYRQSAITTTIRFDTPHDGVATQHFLPGGPFAILPLPQQRACITWSEDEAEARRCIALDDSAFQSELVRRVGAKPGPFVVDGPRAIWPLDMHLPRAFAAPRLALIGDAAHGVHPIAGQGLNLSFRDVAALAECVLDGLRVGLDAGDPQILSRYQRWRRFDTMLSTAAFDALNRTFSNDVALVRSAREAGLGLVDRLPALKRLIVAEAAGQTGDVPRLLRGAPA